MPSQLSQTAAKLAVTVMSDDAEKNLANAKYDYLLSQLNLELAAGTLSPQSINEINGFLN